MPQQPPALSEKSTPELLGAFVDEGRVLLNEQLRTAKLELLRDVDRAKISAALLSLGAAFATLGGAGLAITAALLLSMILPVWAAAAIVAGALSLVGGVLILVGRSQLRRMTLKPEQTLRELKEDGRWMKQAIQIVYANRHSSG